MRASRLKSTSATFATPSRLVLRFQSDHSNPTFQLRQVKVMGQVGETQGFVHIAGRVPKPKG